MPLMTYQTSENEATDIQNAKLFTESSVRVITAYSVQNPIWLEWLFLTYSNEAFPFPLLPSPSPKGSNSKEGEETPLNHSAGRDPQERRGSNKANQHGRLLQDLRQG